jgi:hypothetical protein
MSFLSHAVSLLTGRSNATVIKQHEFTSVAIQSTKPWKAPNVPAVSDPKLYWYQQIFSADYDAAAVFHYAENHPATATGHRNAFYSMFDVAYANHGQVVLTPDDIWTCISVQFAKYVEANAEALRDLFVSFSGKQKITIDMNSVDYELFMTLVVDQIAKRTKGGVTESLKYDFSTSTEFDQTMGHLSTMTAMKHYFKYGMRMMCGIQCVYFTGTLDDWQKLRQKTARLIETYHLDKSEYIHDFKAWGKQIDVILGEFIETYQGRVNLTFWNGVLDLHCTHGSGATTTIQGWIVPLISNKSLLELHAMPSCGFEVPVEINNNGLITNVKVVGGFSGLVIDNATGMVRTQRSYAVIDLSKAQEFKRKRDEVKAEIERLEAEISELYKTREPIDRRLQEACSKHWYSISADDAERANVSAEYERVIAINQQTDTIRDKIYENNDALHNLPTAHSDDRE